MIEMFTQEEREDLLEGKRVVIGNSIYLLCFNCRCVVKVNKFFFGSMHVCNE
jgi:hypothetical protein